MDKIIIQQISKLSLRDELCGIDDVEIQGTEIQLIETDASEIVQHMHPSHDKGLEDEQIDCGKGNMDIPLRNEIGHTTDKA